MQPVASAIDLNQAISKHYLDTLASQLCIPSELVFKYSQRTCPIPIKMGHLRPTLTSASVMINEVF